MVEKINQILKNKNEKQKRTKCYNAKAFKEINI